MLAKWFHGDHTGQMKNSVSTQDDTIEHLIQVADLGGETRQRISDKAAELVCHIRSRTRPGMMELFLAEYGLSTDEGVALMCLAEALLRVPDAHTMDALIEDKIAPSQWGRHLGQSHSSLVNASTWALFVTGKVLDEKTDGSVAATLRGALKRLGEPVIRQAVARVMKEMGRQFVLGETIEAAMQRARAMEQYGYTYSYDMLGEAARTERDARRYHLAYCDAISEIAKAAAHDDTRKNPGISIKLSALHPRYETIKHQRVMDELLPRARSLAMLAKSAGIGLNVDAEEAGRLDLSLDIIETLLADPALAGWDGFGVVVQAYGTRALEVIEKLYETAVRFDRKIMVRLVKGAYWDTEIKHAQVNGHGGYPVFTRKHWTDVSYIACARSLLGRTDRIYPQFATHNAHTLAAVLEMAKDRESFEFQRLHGMGEALHQTVMEREGTRCRVYAPVGAHKDLLAYLVRRLLENGANSSFVNQIVDEDVPAEIVAADPFRQVKTDLGSKTVSPIRLPSELFSPERSNSAGFDMEDPHELGEIRSGMARFSHKIWKAHYNGNGSIHPIANPANGERVGNVAFCTSDDAERACETVKVWHVGVEERSAILWKAADLYEENSFELFALLCREAGKTLADCIGEVREAVDFLRYYAANARSINGEPAGIFACISPWNFPLAIFTGQISAALAMGNGVVAKPAEATPLVADFAVQLLHRAGVPMDALMLLPGTGTEIGNVITAHPRIAGVCFTGSTATAHTINRNMAQSLPPHVPLIAETGGLNAMIVDSTALPEQAVRDVLASAFQSAGQRCSALRVLYVQDDIYDGFMAMLSGAMDELEMGDPWDFTTDVGPVIDVNAQARIEEHIQVARSKGRVLRQLGIANHVEGTFVAPTVIEVSGISDLEEEIFGPVLHVARFRAGDLDEVIDAVNAKGYGLTFGLHTRIDDRVQHIVERVKAGNIYVNRNQIGAVVGSQPFGGEGLSGTGPKAGGPRYLHRFAKQRLAGLPPVDGHDGVRAIGTEEIERAFSNQAGEQTPALETIDLPGPTGESNRYQIHCTGRVLCLGPGVDRVVEQVRQAKKLGCNAVGVAPGFDRGIDGQLPTQVLAEVSDLAAVVCEGDDLSAYRQALASRSGPIVPLLMDQDFARWLVLERHLCVDITAAGGNAALLEEVGSNSQNDRAA